MTTFPRSDDGPIVVVGAGTAGSVVTRRLIDAGYEVLLLEAGSVDLPSEQRLAAIDHLGTHLVDDRWWRGITSQRTAMAVPTEYLLGRGMGGSSAVNGLVADWDPDDPAFGSFGGTHRARAAVLVQTERVATAELGTLGRLLLRSPGARLVDLARQDGRRSDAATAYLKPLITGLDAVGSTLHIRGDAVVDRLVFARRPSIVTTDGERIEARAIVLCAGAINTPALLLRSDVVGGVGSHLQDHPSVALHLDVSTSTRDDATHTVVSGVVAERDGVQFLPLEHLGDNTDAGGFLVAIMNPAGANGSVVIDPADPDGLPLVRFETDRTATDLRRLGAGVRRALDLLQGPLFTGIVNAITIDDAGTPAAVLADDSMLERWLRRSSGAYYHAAASCGIGRALDHMGRLVDSGAVYVADASAFPRIPRTGTHLPTLVQAERLVAGWLASAGSS